LAFDRFPDGDAPRDEDYMSAAFAKIVLCYLVKCSAEEKALVRQEFAIARHSFCTRHLIDDDPYDEGGDYEK
jgi:hypothetical protein